MRNAILLLLICFLFSHCATLVNQGADQISILSIQNQSKNAKTRIILIEDYMEASFRQGNLYPKKKKRVKSKLDNLGLELCQGCIIPSCCQPPSCDPNTGANCPTQDFLMGSIQGIDVERIEIRDRDGNPLFQASINKVEGTVSRVTFPQKLPDNGTMHFGTSKGNFAVDIRRN